MPLAEQDYLKSWGFVGMCWVYLGTSDLPHVKVILESFGVPVFVTLKPLAIEQNWWNIGLRGMFTYNVLWGAFGPIYIKTIAGSFSALSCLFICFLFCFGGMFTLYLGSFNPTHIETILEIIPCIVWKQATICVWPYTPNRIPVTCPVVNI